MKTGTPEEEKQSACLYHHLSVGQDGQIETVLSRDENGVLSLTCRRRFCGGEEAVCLKDLGREASVCVAFAGAVAESRTYPRMLPELWEEFYESP